MRKLAGCAVVLAMLVGAPAAEAKSVTIAAAGDIATSGPGDSLTAALIKVLDPDRVLTLGDNAYPDGTLRQFKEHYHPTWGAFKGKTSLPWGITTTTPGDPQGTSGTSAPGPPLATTPTSWALGGW